MFMVNKDEYKNILLNNASDHHARKMCSFVFEKTADFIKVLEKTLNLFLPWKCQIFVRCRPMIDCCRCRVLCGSLLSEHGQHEVSMAVVDVIVKDEQIDNTELHAAPSNLHASRGSSVTSSRQLVHDDCTESIPLLPS